MSTKTKDNRDSPKSSSRAKRRGKDALESRTLSSPHGDGFALGFAMAESIRKEDIQRIMSIQNKSLKNFAKTNELLGKFNDFSSSKYDVLQHMFLQHTRLLVDLKKDLSNAFLKIRRLKVILQKQYPEAFEATFNLRQNLEDRLEQEEMSKPTYGNNTKDKSINKKEKKKSKNENVEADDQGRIDSHVDLGAELKHEVESTEIESENSGLLNETEKVNDDMNSEINHDKLNASNKTDAWGLDKTEFAAENCVVNDESTNEERTVEPSSCGNSENFETDVIKTENVQEDNSIHLGVEGVGNVLEGNDPCIDHDEVPEGITEGIKDCLVIEGSNEMISDEKCCDETNDGD